MIHNDAGDLRKTELFNTNSARYCIFN